MSSDIAKKVAGTYIEDALPTLPPTLAWLTEECRHGHLSEHVELFLAQQPEPAVVAEVLVESIGTDTVVCRVPCRCYDHESSGTFRSDVMFTLNARTGECLRLPG